MQGWNYRIIKRKYKSTVTYTLHEVYYGEDSEVEYFTTNPISFCSDEDEGPEGLVQSLEMAIKDAKKYPVLIYEELMEKFEN